MRCPKLNELPEPPEGKMGWPWTEESRPLLPSMPDGKEWPRITIVTPSFNQGAFIEETLRSVLLQGYPNLEYIVMDGGSTDTSVEIIKKYSPWISCWVSEPDSGQSDAINRGLQAGSGLFATWINSDDLLCKNALVEHVTQNGCDSHTVYVGICLYVDRNGEIFSSHRGRVYSLEDLVRIRTVWRSGGHIVQPEVLFPRELALAVGGLNPNNHRTMDYELWGKLLLSGATFCYTDVCFGMFREHPDQKTQNVLEQTRSLLDTAAKLVGQAGSLSEATKSTILADLQAYGDAYERQYWAGTGRLARLPLPRELIALLRSAKATLGTTAKSLFSTIRQEL